MHGSIPFAVASAIEISRQECVKPRRTAETPDFARVARILWPEKTAATLASLVGASPRTAERWVSGEIDPPYEVIELTMHRLFSRRRPVRE
jgi:hypothetical protein